METPRHPAADSGGWGVPGVGPLGGGGEPQGGGKPAPEGFARHASPEIAQARAALEALAGRERRLDSDQTRLADALAAVELAGRLEMLACQLVAEADSSGASWRACGAKTATMLSWDGRHTRKQACAFGLRGGRLNRFPATAQAALAGRANPAQAEQIARELEAANRILGVDALQRMEAALVEDAERFNSAALASRARQLVAELADDGQLEAAEAAQAERDYQRAIAHREVRFADDHHGSIHIRGQLPTADGLLVQRCVEAFAERAHPRPAAGGATPAEPSQAGGGWVGAAARPPRPQRLADGLVALAERAAAAPDVPRMGDARPQLIVTCDIDRLRAGLAGATLAGADRRLSASELRRLACDCDVLPAVM
ncbi:MAG: 13E12 repeat family protein, partial [Bifidobacteriaceae bacterium]|nr:13E12 repeat family protein [Bifidobacteriaceae bacterium]